MLSLRTGCLTSMACVLLVTSVPAAEADDYWVAPMKAVHARFKGQKGTFAQFGDSITITMAYWAGLAGTPQNLDTQAARAHDVIQLHMNPDCWNKWKGPQFGNQGSMTIRWAHENVDEWLKKLNPEVVLIMFGTNDLGPLKVDEYTDKTRQVVRRCLDNGTVVILSTLPPKHGQLDKARSFADAVRTIAKEEKVPLVDYFGEILKRRPDDWDGALPQFKVEKSDTYDVPTLICRDGVHPSNPKDFKDFSEESLSKNGYALRGYLTLLAYAQVAEKALDAPKPEEVIRKAVSFYASYDESIDADKAGGARSPDTRLNHPTEKNQIVVEKGYDAKVFKIAKDKGISGSALEATDVLPRNGRIFYPAKGNLAWRKGGWGGALSVWINTDPNKLLKTKFCDPIQITHKGAHNGAIWFDFNDAKPRDMRHGAFTALKEGEKAIPEEDPKAPMVRIKGVDLKEGDWHHVAISWNNFDTGKADAESILYVNGKKIGAVDKRAIAMDWDMDKCGIYFVINYIGLFDELALFDRPLTADEVGLLHKTPGLLAALKQKEKKGSAPSPRLKEFAQRLEAGKDLPALGKDMRGFLKTPDGQASAESVLDLLLSLPRTGQAPAAPKWPFEAEAARKYQQAYADYLGVPLEFTNRVGMTFVLVPPGVFEMGTPKDEPGHGASEYGDEQLHTVTLTKPFYLSKHETTVGQWRAYIDATNYITDIEKAGGGNAHDGKAEWKHRPGTQWRKPGFAGPYEMTDKHPVIHVSVTDSLEFCKWLNAEAGAKTAYDLPTEAQWEWSCRAGSPHRYWWGKDEDATGKVINCCDKTLKKFQPDWPRQAMGMDDGHAFPAPAGTYRANAFGLHDMLGNVWEFCSTRFGPYGKDPVTDPGDLDPKRGYAVRGGGWSNTANDVRSGSRNADPPHFGHSNLGFRVKLTLSP